MDTHSFSYLFLKSMLPSCFWFIYISLWLIFKERGSNSSYFSICQALEARSIGFILTHLPRTHYHCVYVYIQWYIYTHNIYIWLCIHIHILEVLTLSFRWLKLIFLAHNSATFKHIYSVLLNVFIGKLTKYRTEFSKAITWTCDWPSAFS